MNNCPVKMKPFEFLNLIMGNSSQSVLKKENNHLKLNALDVKIPIRKGSYPATNSYTDNNLGRLRSIDIRIGKTIAQPHEIEDGLYLHNLKHATSFIFLRKCEKPHGGFGFYCDTTYRQDITDKKIVTQQMSKPKRKFQGLEDGPLDVFDISPDVQRQILGIVPTKLSIEDKRRDVIEGAQIYCVEGIIGFIHIKEDWTNAYEIKNSDEETILIAQRFNRLSGGYEFQIYTLGHSELTTVVATLVRLEEAKFILKIYTSCPPPVKALLISFTLFFMYLISR